MNTRAKEGEKAGDEHIQPLRNLQGPTTVAVIGLVSTALPLLLPLLKDLSQKNKSPGTRCLVSLRNYTTFGVEHHSVYAPRGTVTDIGELPVVPPTLHGSAAAPYVFENSFGIENYDVPFYRAPACLAQWKILCTRPIYLLAFVWMARLKNNDNCGFFRLYEEPQDLERFWDKAELGRDYFEYGMVGSKCDRKYGDWGLNLDGSLNNENPGTFSLVLSET